MPDVNRFIPVGGPDYGLEEEEAVLQVLRSGWLTTGPKVTEFEQKVCEFLGGGVYAVALNSCTAGLFLALKALGIGTGDEVIVPCVTYVATAHVVEWTGATVVMVDIDPLTRNLDQDLAIAAITSRTKAVIPVHMAGLACDLERLEIVCAQNSIAIIEDAAHAMGTKWRGIPVGQRNQCAVFSFYANKNLSCGEGGMLISTDAKFVDEVRKLSYFGIDKSAFHRYSASGSWYYEVERLGYKYNMDSIHAALGLAQLKKYQAMLAKRRMIADFYRDRIVRKSALPAFDEGHVWHLFQLLTSSATERDMLVTKLREHEIGSSVHFIPLYRHPHYRENFSPDKFPNSEAVFPCSISLPISTRMSDCDAGRVIDVVNSVLHSEV